MELDTRSLKCEPPLPDHGVKWPYEQILARFKERRDERTVLIPVLRELLSHVTFPRNANVCLSIGPGMGQNDLDFLQMLPDLKKYVAIDKQASCLKLLKVNFKKIFGESVVYEGHETDIAEWEPQGDKGVDIVWMSHMLYTIPRHMRLIAFDKLINKIIKPRDGVVIFVNNTRDNVFQKLHNELGIQPLLTSEEIKEDFDEVGGRMVWNRVYSCYFEGSKYDHDLWHYLMEFSDRVLTPREIMKAMEVVRSSGKVNYQSEVCVVKCCQNNR